MDVDAMTRKGKGKGGKSKGKGKGSKDKEKGNSKGKDTEKEKVVRFEVTALPKTHSELIPAARKSNSNRVND